MVDITVPRVSALSGHYVKGRHGAAGDGVTIKEPGALVLWQLAAWPESLGPVSKAVADDLALGAVVSLGKALSSENGSMLRIEPLKFWVHGNRPKTFDADQAVLLDLSHSRTQLTISGPCATKLLNGYLPLDLREGSFPVGSVASTAFHHVGVTLWRSASGYELFLPRGFALSLWELLQESAAQYGLVIE